MILLHVVSKRLLTLIVSTWLWCLASSNSAASPTQAGLWNPSDLTILSSRLGRGGFGEVVHAQYRKRGFQSLCVAVKLLRNATAARQEWDLVRKIQAKLGQKYRGPLYYDYLDNPRALVATDAAAGIVMERVEGENLHDLIHGGMRGMQFAIECGLQLTESIGWLHWANYMHGDIKPANIIRDYAGNLRVLDYGLTVPFSSTSGISGTPGYRAPEIKSGRHVAAHATMDIYSLGATLFHIATGYVPNAGQSQNWSLLPPPLRPVIEKAMAPNPRHRHQSTAELHRELKAISAR